MYVCALIDLVTSTFNLLTLKLVHFVARRMATLVPSLVFHSPVMGQLPLRQTTLPCYLDPWPWRSCTLSAIRVFVLHLYTKFQVRKFRRYDALPVSALVDPVSLTFWIWNWCALLHMRLAIILSFLVFCAFSFFTHGPTPVRRITWPCDLDLRPWRPRRLSVIRVFVALLAQKTLRIFCASRPGDLDLWPLTLKLVCIITRGVGNHSTKFGVSTTFHSRSIGQTCQTHHVTLRPWPFILEVTALLHVTDLCCPSGNQVRTS